MMFRFPQAPVALMVRLTVVLLVLGMITSASASAATIYETVDHFGGSPTPKSEGEDWPEDAQLGGVAGMAINLTGAGGVAPGTVYTVGSGGGAGRHAARYSPEGDFELAWSSLGRCGPAAAPPSVCSAFPNGGGGEYDIAVDQTTGNVFIFDLNGSKVLSEYKADGTGPIAVFGEREAGGSGTSTPAKIHSSPANENIAVDNSGKVYVFDEATSFGSDFYHRLMVFEPQTPGDYENYVYAGAGSDIAAGFTATTRPPARPVLDSAGNIYVAGDDYIDKYDPAQSNSPTCTFTFSPGGITSLTVNPATGAPFFYSYKDRRIHQLSPCNGEGKFVEKDAQGAFTAGPSFSAVPQRGFIEAMAFNPGQAIGERPAGVLYAATPTNCPLTGSCPPDAVGQGALGYIFAAQASLVPAVVSQSVTQVGVTSATLNARIDPRGSQTTYVFQYISDSAYQANDPSARFEGAAEAPSGGALLGNSQPPVLATATVSGLAPGTAYRYRIVATNSAGTTAGAAELLKTFPLENEGLPDGRAYELVSPAGKNGGQVLPAAPNVASCGSECKPGWIAKRFPVQVLPDGSAVAYQGAPFTLNEGISEFDQYISTRSAAGWQTTSLSPPLSGDALGSGFREFSLDASLAHGIVSVSNPLLSPEAPAEYQNLFGQPTASRLNISPILKSPPPNRPPNGQQRFKLEYVGATADHSRVFFEANDALTGPTSFAPSAVDGGVSKFNLYEWSGGQIHLVNVLPGNAETLAGAVLGSGFQLSTDASGAAANFSHAISSDGTRVFWTAGGTGPDAGALFVRVGGEETVKIPGPGNCKASVPQVARVCFLTASADGTQVLLSNGQIYQLDAATGSYEAGADLTSGAGGFRGLAGQSDDLSHAYFVAQSVLPGSGPNSMGDEAEAGGFNLYAWHEGVTAFIGTLDSKDDNESSGVWHASPVKRSAEASPTGRWLAFNSGVELTGVGSVGKCKFDPTVNKYNGAVPCVEVFLYDSQSGTLTCASCNSVGAHPLGDSFLRRMHEAAGFLPQPRYLTDSGRLFFDSRDSLSALDTNNGVEDVYQYEPAGIGSCDKAGGCVSLISSGRGSYDSNFLAMDPSGDNVFFTTRQQLVPRDQDALIDLYDARVGGGLAVDYPEPPSECVGEGCQPAVPPVPSGSAPASSTFQGPGNLKPKRATKKHHKKKHKHKKSKAKGAKHGRGGSK